MEVIILEELSTEMYYRTYQDRLEEAWRNSEWMNFVKDVKKCTLHGDSKNVREMLVGWG